MSANNQTLIQKHNGQYYVFEHVMAESWDNVNVLDSASGVAFGSKSEAFEYASKLEKEDPTEYGIGDSILRKDCARITIT